MHSWLNNAQNVAFLFQSYFDYVTLTQKRYQALHVCSFCILESLGTRLVYIMNYCYFAQASDDKILLVVTYMTKLLRNLVELVLKHRYDQCKYISLAIVSQS